MFANDATQEKGKKKNNDQKDSNIITIAFYNELLQFKA